jgi:hypothetical protein
MRQVAVVLAAFVCGCFFALSIHSSIANTPSSETASSGQLMPPCPRTTYSEDGGVGPAFCVIANPAAVHFFVSEGSKTIALGPDATPAEVVSALKSDFRKIGGLPVLCEVYQIAAWRNQWNLNFTKPSFIDSVGKELRAYDGWCEDPHFRDPHFTE